MGWRPRFEQSILTRSTLGVARRPRVLAAGVLASLFAVLLALLLPGVSRAQSTQEAGELTILDTDYSAGDQIIVQAGLMSPEGNYEFSLCMQGSECRSLKEAAADENGEISLKIDLPQELLCPCRLVATNTKSRWSITTEVLPTDASGDGAAQSAGPDAVDNSADTSKGISVESATLLGSRSWREYFGGSLIRQVRVVVTNKYSVPASGVVEVRLIHGEKLVTRHSIFVGQLGAGEDLTLWDYVTLPSLSVGKSRVEATAYKSAPSARDEVLSIGFTNYPVGLLGVLAAWLLTWVARRIKRRARGEANEGDRDDGAFGADDNGGDNPLEGPASLLRTRGAPRDPRRPAQYDSGMNVAGDDHSDEAIRDLLFGEDQPDGQRRLRMPFRRPQAARPVPEEHPLRRASDRVDTPAPDHDASSEAVDSTSKQFSDDLSRDDWSDSDDSDQRWLDWVRQSRRPDA